MSSCSGMSHTCLSVSTLLRKVRCCVVGVSLHCTLRLFSLPVEQGVPVRVQWPADDRPAGQQRATLGHACAGSRLAYLQGIISCERTTVHTENVLQTQEEAYLKIKKIRFGYFNDKVSSPRRVHTFELFEQVRSFALVAKCTQTKCFRCRLSRSC